MSAQGLHRSGYMFPSAPPLASGGTPQVGGLRIFRVLEGFRVLELNTLKTVKTHPQVGAVCRAPHARDNAG